MWGLLWVALSEGNRTVPRNLVSDDFRTAALGLTTVILVTQTSCDSECQIIMGCSRILLQLKRVEYEHHCISCSSVACQNTTSLVDTKLASITENQLVLS